VAPPASSVARLPKLFAVIVGWASSPSYAFCFTSCFCVVFLTSCSCLCSRVCRGPRVL